MCVGYLGSMYCMNQICVCLRLFVFLKASGRDTYGDTSSESSNSVPSSPVHHQRSLETQGQLRNCVCAHVSLSLTLSDLHHTPILFPPLML